MKREAGVELQRLFLMFSIVLLHVITLCGRCGRGVDNVLSPAVVGFMFISGYFGVRFTWTKVLRLTGLALVCSVIMALIGVLFCGSRTPPIWWIAHARGYWFLWAYIALLMLSPLLNLGIEACKGRVQKGIEILTPIVVLTYGWSYLKLFPGVGQYIPNVSGFAPLGLLTFCTTYIVARFYRVTFEPALLRCGVWVSWRKYICLGAMIFFGLCCFVGAYHHNSVFAVGLAFCIFEIFRGMRFPSWLSELICFLSPSALSVYLLHGTPVGMELLGHFLSSVTRRLNGYDLLSCIIVAVVGFAACLILDLTRRLILNCLRRI